MTIELFKPEDFDNKPFPLMTPETISRLSNSILNKWLKEKPKIFITAKEISEAYKTLFNCPRTSQSAKGYCTQNYEFLNCEHKIVNRLINELSADYKVGRAIFKCQYCGAELESLGWKVIE